MLKLTRKEKRIARHLLTAARSIIFFRRERHICLALAYADTVTYGYGATVAVRTKLTKLISDRLEGCDTLEGWLARTHKVPFIISSAYSNKARATRLAWIDSIIEELT